MLFACVHNAGRSQIAAALFDSYADPSKARAISAGTQPAARVHPEVVEVMKTRGIDVSGERTAEAHRGARVNRELADHDGLRR